MLVIRAKVSPRWMLTALVAAMLIPALARPLRTAHAEPSSGIPLWIGASLEGLPRDASSREQFSSETGVRPHLLSYYAAFTQPHFDAAGAQEIVETGAVPMLTWEPWDPAAGAVQPRYRLGQIASGAFDAYIRTWAREIRDWDGPLVLRFAHEMNGDWYPWGGRANGNRPKEYVAAYRRVHRLFAEAGADNVSWVWSPNVVYAGSVPLRRLYPGDRFVDWVGVDGYNWGATKPWGWQSPGQVFGATLAEVRALTSRPVMLAEVASAEAGGDKASWIHDLFDYMASRRYIKAVVWFNHNKETDWRVQSSLPARLAFSSEASNVVTPTTRLVP